MIEHDQSMQSSISVHQQPPVQDNVPQEISKNTFSFEAAPVLEEQEATDSTFEMIHGSRYAALDKAEQLRGRNYLVGGKRKSGTRKASPEMQAVLEEMEGLQGFFQAVPFDGNDPEAFEGLCEVLLDRLRHVSEKCENYLIKKNPSSTEGKARYQLVNEISERISRDILSLEERTRDFLALPPQERKRVRTWDAFLNWERTLVFREGEDDVAIHSTGGNTSDVIVLEKGGKKMFFKEEEKLAEADLWQILNGKIDAFAGNMAKDADKDSVGNCCIRFMKNFRNEGCGSPEQAARVVVSFFGPPSADAFADLKKICSNTNLFVFGSTYSMLEEFENIKDEKRRSEVREAIGNLYTSIRKEAIMAKLGNNTANIPAGQNMAKRNVATSRLARMLGLSDLVPASEMASVEVNGQKKYGVVMQGAPGEEVSKAKRHKLGEPYKGSYMTYSTQSIRELLGLQILDALSGQTDRHEGNQMMTIQKREKPADNGTDIYEMKHITGIDGDLSFGRIQYSHIVNSSRGRLLQIEDENGLAIPAMSRSVAEKILAMSPAMLDYEMMGLLSKSEREALTDRLIGIQGAIRRQMDYEAANSKVPSKFIEDDQWPEFHDRLLKTVRKNRSARDLLYSRSYLDPDLLRGIRV